MAQNIRDMVSKYKKIAILKLNQIIGFNINNWYDKTIKLNNIDFNVEYYLVSISLENHSTTPILMSSKIHNSSSNAASTYLGSIYIKSFTNNSITFTSYQQRPGNLIFEEIIAIG